MSNLKNSLAKVLLVGYALSLIPAASQAQTPATGFSDVTPDTQYNQAITYLKDNNIVQGYADGTFGPSNTINRAEFTKILVGALPDVKPTGKNCFPDVKDEWFAPYVCAAKTAGIISGYPDGNFKPDAEINFSEAAKIIATGFKLNLGEQDPAVWFKGYIEALQADNAIPLSVSYFDEQITRDEMSEIIWRIRADIKDKSSRTYAELNGDGLVQAQSCKDLEERFSDLQPPRGPIYYGTMSPQINELAAPTGTNPSTPTMAAPAPAADSTSAGGAGLDYSNTNLQVLGVDEADVVKNDGKYIYLIKGNTIRIIDAYPASSMKELISFQLGPKDQSFYPTDMYVDGNQLVAMGTAYTSYPYPMPLDSGTAPAATSTSSGGATVSPTSITGITSGSGGVSSGAIAMPIYGGSRTKVYIVDITDRTQPKVTRTVDYDGNYQTSRKIGSTLYMVMNKYPYIPYYASGTQPDFSNFLPTMSDSKNNKNQLVVPCTAIRIMPKPKSFNFLITSAIPLNDLTKDVSSSVLVGNGDNVFTSLNNLYVASTDWSGPYYYAQVNSTKVYKFALSNGQIDYKAEGLVPGTILNQFSMDEYLGNFRIATTKSDYFSGANTTTNNVYVLDSNLKTIGKLENLAPGELIHSVRFMGVRGYLVTFKSVDPLFVFDMSDPKNPKTLGQLKIPGYSDYLQPYDDTHIIGFGKDVDPAEAAKDQSYVYYTAVKGFKMGLFDVADPANPKQLFTEIIGDQGTYSELLYNHKALLFDKTKNLIAFPISVTEMPKTEQICKNYTFSTCPSTCNAICTPTCTYQNGVTICDNKCDGVNSCQETTYVYPKTVFVGAYVYGLDLTNGFKLKAKITHLSDLEQADLITNGYLSNYDETIQRIIYIGDTLYTVSQAAVKANTLAAPMTELKLIELAGNIYNLSYGKATELAQ